MRHEGVDRAHPCRRGQLRLDRGRVRGVEEPRVGELLQTGEDERDAEKDPQREQGPTCHRGRAGGRPAASPGSGQRAAVPGARGGGRRLSVGVGRWQGPSSSRGAAPPGRRPAGNRQAYGSRWHRGGLGACAPVGSTAETFDLLSVSSGDTGWHGLPASAFGDVHQAHGRAARTMRKTNARRADVVDVSSAALDAISMARTTVSVATIFDVIADGSGSR